VAPTTRPPHTLLSSHSFRPTSPKSEATLPNSICQRSSRSAPPMMRVAKFLCVGFWTICRGLFCLGAVTELLYGVCAKQVSICEDVVFYMANVRGPCRSFLLFRRLMILRGTRSILCEEPRVLHRCPGCAQRQTCRFGGVTVNQAADWTYTYYDTNDVQTCQAATNNPCRDGSADCLHDPRKCYVRGCGSWRF
jgi:hypothetical protein